MLARSLLRRSAATLSRSYATHAPEGLPPVPKSAAIETSEYDLVEEPALAGMKYPKMYEDSRQLRNPLHYWDKQERVNFGEPVPLNDDLQSVWAPDYHKIAPSSALLQLGIAFSLIGLFAFAVAETRPDAPALPRAFPYDGLVKELSGTDDPQFAVRTDAENQVDE
ncbi:NADH dehydrogenase (ubiquinone) 1 beta subcomplex 8 [Rhodotorula toruloides]|uniref:NADH dehydrogenase (Ubiquinone) 1 beta subcomplex 8 n=1 Tax=Rhodotorula toruloides TaxID=5286 RepID=A0A511KAG1_RHOTO|nr:NADH dehydrogenase (ubiquinone) 1 beta subcomplex 8 [Rhodotorula toruloides]